MARRTEPWADVDSGNRFHENQTEEPDIDPDDAYEWHIEKELREE